MTKSDVVILGSGISALSAALLLAKHGRSVTVLEQYVKPGGYMHCFRRFDEDFDTGAHYVGGLREGEPFRVLLEYLGVFREETFAPLDKNAFDVLHFPSGVVNLPMGYTTIINELSTLFPGERAAIEKYFALIKSVSSAFPTYRFSESPEIFPPEALDRTLSEVVNGITNNERLKGVFYAYCGLHGVIPTDVAFGFHSIVTDSLIEGAYGFNGGGDALTARFVEEIRRNGGQVLTNHRVTELVVDENRHLTTVRTQNGAEFSGDWVISSIHPKTTLRLLSRQDIFPPVFKDRLASMRESTGIFGLYAVCEGRPPVNPDQNHYYFNSDDPEQMFAATNPGDPPTVLFMASPKRRWAADEKGFPLSLHAASPYEWFQPWREDRYGRRSADYKAFKNKIARSLLGAVERHQPGFSANVRDFVTSTPLTNLHFNGTEEGAAYGIYHSMQNTGARALGPRTKVLNLLLTGQNCLFPGLLGAATSALRTCGHIIGIKPVLEELARS